jgi:hypothetical protein
MSSVGKNQFGDVSDISGGRIEDLESLGDEEANAHAEEQFAIDWNNRNIYYSRNCGLLAQLANDAVTAAHENIRRAISNAVTIVQENEI